MQVLPRKIENLIGRAPNKSGRGLENVSKKVGGGDSRVRSIPGSIYVNDNALITDEECFQIDGDIEVLLSTGPGQSFRIIALRLQFCDMALETFSWLSPN